MKFILQTEDNVLKYLYSKIRMQNYKTTVCNTSHLISTDCYTSEE